MQYFNKNRYSNNTIIVIQNILQITYTMRKKDSTDDPTTPLSTLYISISQRLKKI